jgi:hypothetical protein
MSGTKGFEEISHFEAPGRYGDGRATKKNQPEIRSNS